MICKGDDQMMEKFDATLSSVWQSTDMRLTSSPDVDKFREELLKTNA